MLTTAHPHKCHFRKGLSRHCVTIHLQILRLNHIGQGDQTRRIFCRYSQNQTVVKTLRYNTITNTEAQSLWSGWPKKKDALPFFLQNWTSMPKWTNAIKPWECIYVLKLRLWADFWGIENKCDKTTSSENKRRNDVFTKQKCTRCAINIFSFGTWGLGRRYDMFNK